MSSAKHPRLVQVVLDTVDARRAAEFWRELLGWSYRPGDEPPAAGGPDLRGADWLVLRHPEGGVGLAFQQVAEQARTTWPDQAVPQQLHLDHAVPDLDALRRQHDRVLALGGVLPIDRTDDPPEPPRVYADPDGHPFCVFVG